MDSIDAMRTIVAAVLGVVAAVFFSGALPLSGSLAVGVLAYTMVRRGFDAVEYGIHGLLVLFVVVSAATAIGDIPPDAPVAEAVAVLLVSVGLVFAYETLLRVGVAAAAGGFEDAPTRDWWSVPGSIVGILAAVNERIGTDGYEASVLAGFGVGFAGLHMLLAAAAPNAALTAPVTFVATACLGGAVLAATPRLHFDDSLRGSLFLAVLRPIWRFIAVVKATRNRNQGQSTEQASGSSRPTTDGGSATSSQKGGTASGAAAESDGQQSNTGLLSRMQSTLFPSAGAKASGTRSDSSAGKRSHDDPSPWPDDTSDASDSATAGGSTGTTDESAAGETTEPSARSESSSSRRTDTGKATADPATGTADTATADDAESETSSEPEQCENCGRDGPNVAVRAIVDAPPRSPADNAIALCAPCQYARASDDPARCRTGLPVDRSQILDSAGGACECCGSTDDLELHAVVPMESRGHPHEHNVVALCPDCHRAVHD